MDVYERMKQAGIELPPPPVPGGLYTPARPFCDRLVYTSGCGPQVNGAPLQWGRSSFAADRVQLVIKP